ncbi:MULTISPECIES: ATP-binding protein [unclassified Streptomyces]|uniref:ATP-binding protein n=1 Tax=unclassified Streptomyces TaxID=2593676 RepID=UPI00278BD8EB|nr:MULTISPECIES: ATP-binding protein [unclassified Streptomyces]
MDPTNRGPEEFSHDRHDQTADSGGRPRPPRDPLTPDFGQPSPALARAVQLVSGDYLLTVNPVDGSEIEPCPPGERPERPAKYDATERAALARAARPPLPPGPAQPQLPLLERQEERERLVRLLARGRSVRLTGPSGSGRTALLDQVTEDCADIAPDGVVRLCGHRRSVEDLLYDLFAAVHSAPLHRPDRALLLELVHEIGAVVVLDDLEFGGAALDELLEATPECAFLLAATPDVPAPSPDSHVEEVFLAGLGRVGGQELLERAVGRVLTDEEAQWAADLWFESEGLPLRFVQAGALLRQRDRLSAGAGEFDAFGSYEGPGAAPVDAPFDAPFGAPADAAFGAPADAAFDAPFDAADGHSVPLPALAEAAAPAALLASRLSGSARATLEFAVALGGEIPHQAHLPALIGDTHADAALAELVSCGLVTPVGARYRLAAGVRQQLETAGYGTDSAARGRTAARHYAWWAAHPSVGPERTAAESDALLAALSATTDPDGSVELARAAAPAFAAGLAWSAWERALGAGVEAARTTGQVSEEAYFHHESGVLALLGGQLDRARVELESALALRGAAADKRGTIAARRALALVADRSGGAAAGEEIPEAMYEESASPPGGVPSYAQLPQEADDPETLVTRQAAPTPTPPAPTVVGGAKAPSRKSVVSGARRNMVAAGAGALLAAVLGTVVTLGATSGNDDPPSNKVDTNPSATAGENGGELGADEANKGVGGGGGGDASTSAPAGPDGIPNTSDDPTPSSGATDEPSDSPSGSKTPADPSKPPTKSPSKSPSKPPPTTPSKPPPTTTTPTPTPTPTPTKPTETATTPTTPNTSDTASGPITQTPTTTSTI